MKFGIFYEHQLPRNWDKDSEHRLFKQALDQVELADKLGFDYAWEVEHHFLEEYSHSSAPEVFLAAASQRTKNIRLGHGIIQLTTNHPARVAEKVATLDLVSDGRVELGLGEGASVTELHPFNLRFRDKRDVWEDGVRCVLPMFWNHGWEYDGEYFKFPMRAVVPKPLQKPHPPLWVACSQLDTIRYAAHRGMGSLCFKFADLKAAQAWVNAYYNTYLRDLEKLCDYQTNPNIAVVSGFMCAATDEEAWQKADGWTFFQFALQLYNKEGPFEPGSVNIWERYQEWKQTPAGQKRTGQRADRLAGNHPHAAARARSGQRRSGHPAEPGRQEHARRHLQQPRTVRARSDARVPCARTATPAMESGGARGRNRARRHRHRTVQLRRTR